jgi:hypothetical protein
LNNLGSSFFCLRGFSFLYTHHDVAATSVAADVFKPLDVHCHNTALQAQTKQAVSRATRVVTIVHLKHCGALQK